TPINTADIPNPSATRLTVTGTGRRHLARGHSDGSTPTGPLVVAHPWLRVYPVDCGSGATYGTGMGIDMPGGGGGSGGSSLPSTIDTLRGSDSAVIRTP